MKPCRHYKKKVALFAASALPKGEHLEAQNHLRECAACRAYFDEMANLCEQHRTAATGLASVPSDFSFVPQTLRQIHAIGAIDETRMKRQRVLQFACGAGVLILLACLGLEFSEFQRPHQDRITTNPPSLPVATPPSDSKQIAYHLAISRSSDEFDLLLREANAPANGRTEPSYRLKSAWRDLDL